jgi:tRNA-(ms[2]io[6]A)-hydroxylase
MPPVRRLPVLKSDPDAGEDRPAWHWIPIGLVLIVSIWAPLAMIAGFVARRVTRALLGDLPPDELSLRLADASAGDRFGLWFVLTATPLLAYAVSCSAAGAMVGRFGGKAGRKEAAIAGALAALAGAGLTLLNSTLAASAASLLMLVPIGTGAAWLGGSFGVRRRAR